MLSVIYAKCHLQALDVEYHYAECHYAECCYAECCYAECRYAECHYAECSKLAAFSPTPKCESH